MLYSRGFWGLKHTPTVGVGHSPDSDQRPPFFLGDHHLQERYNTPLEHTPDNPPRQLWKESLYGLLVEVARGVFQFGVLKQL